MTKRRGTEATAACTGTRRGNAGSPRSPSATPRPASGSPARQRQDQDRGPDQAQGGAARPRRRAHHRARHGYTVADAVNDWLAYGLTGRPRTRSTSTRPLPAPTSSPRSAPASCAISPPTTSTGGWRTRPRRSAPARCDELHSVPATGRSPGPWPGTRSSATWSLLCDVPTGQDGRPSKSLTLDQAKALLAAAEDSRCTPTSWCRC